MLSGKDLLLEIAQQQRVRREHVEVMAGRTHHKGEGARNDDDDHHDREGRDVREGLDDDRRCESEELVATNRLQQARDAEEQRERGGVVDGVLLVRLILDIHETAHVADESQEDDIHDVPDRREV